MSGAGKKSGNGPKDDGKGSIKSQGGVRGMNVRLKSARGRTARTSRTTRTP